MDRDKISALGLTVNQVETALYNAYGTRQVSQIYAPNNQYQVILQVAPEYQKDPAALSMLYVRSIDRRSLIPLEHGREGDAPTSGPLAGQPHRAAAVGDDLVQPEAGLSRSATPSTAIQTTAAADAAVDDGDQLPGRGAGVPGFAAGARPDSADGDRRHLHRPRRFSTRASRIR